MPGRSKDEKTRKKGLAKIEASWRGAKRFEWVSKGKQQKLKGSNVFTNIYE